MQSLGPRERVESKLGEQGDKMVNNFNKERNSTARVLLRIPGLSSDDLPKAPRLAQHEVNFQWPLQLYFFPNLKTRIPHPPRQRREKPPNLTGNIPNRLRRTNTCQVVFIIMMKAKFVHRRKNLHKPSNAFQIFKVVNGGKTANLIDHEEFDPTKTERWGETERLAEAVTFEKER
ncbi:hypothetical protein JAAARDRAFT_48487 [Jaapia argillacea MUCL 33604]|uniref:Uncharacterized protein n=1 Tax=Jaapia argillacea MUCL 33604 TaxID=933084 RepID=A0A067PQT6_9AGAM|nr:hypothetical protein JAAARDRAFT_48487 [Jaapia argillacea MUCL 33604]